MEIESPEGHTISIPDEVAIPAHILAQKTTEWGCTTDEAIRRLYGLPSPLETRFEQQLTGHGTLFCPLCRLTHEVDYAPALQWITTETTQRAHPYLVADSRMVTDMHPLNAARPVWPTEPEVLHAFLWCHLCNSEYTPAQFGILP